MSQPVLERVMGTVQARCEAPTKTGNCDLASNYFGTTSICSAINLVLDENAEKDGVFTYCDNSKFRCVSKVEVILEKNTQLATLPSKVRGIFLIIFNRAWRKINEAFGEDDFGFKCSEEERPNLRVKVMLSAVAMIANMVTLNDSQPHEDIKAKFEKQEKLVDLLKQFDLSIFNLVEANLALIEGKITKTQAAKLLRMASNLHPEPEKPNLKFQHKEFKDLLSENIKLNDEVNRLEQEHVISLENVQLLLQLDFRLLKFLIESLMESLEDTKNKSNSLIEEFEEKVKVLSELEKFSEAGLLIINRDNKYLLKKLLDEGKVYIEKMPSFLIRIDRLVCEKKMSLNVARSLKDDLRKSVYSHVLLAVEQQITKCEGLSDPLGEVILEVQIKQRQGYLTAKDAEAIMALPSVDEMNNVLALNEANCESLALDFEG